MQQPEGFEEKSKEKMVCKLKKSLYGLKQAAKGVVPQIPLKGVVPQIPLIHALSRV